VPQVEERATANVDEAAGHECEGLWMNQPREYLLGIRNSAIVMSGRYDRNCPGGDGEVIYSADEAMGDPFFLVIAGARG
jgi:Ethanolamine utilization protein EutJ (predicted chaperonin)